MGVPPEQSRPRRLLLFALLAVAVVAVLVGVAAIADIGPFDSDGEELTADDIVARGDEICTEAASNSPNSRATRRRAQPRPRSSPGS
jgi:hypothetical protein